MLDEICQLYGVQPIINAVGYATRVSGSAPHPDVLHAIREASGLYWEIDDLLAAASRLIAESTCTEAGIVTSGASSALTLAAAAVLSGDDPEIMDRLPDTSGCARHEIIYPIPGPYDYDHAIRLSGARMVAVDYQAIDAMERIAQQITPQTAAIGYVWSSIVQRPELSSLIELAHRHQLPVIVDAACALPPVENLSTFGQWGADLIAYSGGKHLGGPQASGILCGREQLIRSAWVQMVDMDVRSETWSLQHWVESGWIPRSPRHGIGRSMKVSKEGIIGVMAALLRYPRRPHAAEYARWKQDVDEIAAGLESITELQLSVRSHGINGQPIPMLVIESGSGSDKLLVRDLVLALRRRPRRIILAEDERTTDKAYLYAQCLLPGDVFEIIEAIQDVATNHRERKHV